LNAISFYEIANHDIQKATLICFVSSALVRRVVAIVGMFEEARNVLEE
jgi:hypothetical protein